MKELIVLWLFIISFIIVGASLKVNNYNECRAHDFSVMYCARDR